jgi:hypothetical protein
MQPVCQPCGRAEPFGDVERPERDDVTSNRRNAKSDTSFSVSDGRRITGGAFVALIRSYQQPWMRYSISESTLSSWISCDGQIHWLSLRFLDEQWIFDDAYMVTTSFSYGYHFDPRPGSSFLSAGGGGIMSLRGGYVPWWTNTRVDPLPGFAGPPIRFPVQAISSLQHPLLVPCRSGRLDHLAHRQVLAALIPAAPLLEIGPVRQLRL